jgi:hypothetical protein
MADKIQLHEVIPTIESIIDEKITFHDEAGAKVREELIESMRSITGLHVRAALHSASEKVTCKVKHDYEKDPGTYDITISKQSILTAYPLENIK